MATQGLKWWEKEPLRIIEICNGMDMEEFSPQAEVEAVKKFGGNVQHFHCIQNAGGWDEKGFFFETGLAKKKNPDRIKKYLPLAHKAGIRVIVYFNVHWYNKTFGGEHPDWLQIKEDGNPIDDVYATGTSFCINSSYREWVFQILRDLCKYEIDGIFYDGPIFFASTCYCEECKKLFREKTGEEMPPKSNRQHSLWKELIKFQADSLARFLSESDAVIKNANQEILFYMNGNGKSPCWPTGRDNHKIIKDTDVLGAEGGFISGDLNQVSIYKPGIAAKLLSSQSTGKPTVVFDCAGHKLWSWYLLPKMEIGLLLAETLSSGANCWVALFPDDISQPELEVLTSYNNLIKKNPDSFFQTKSLAKIALMWPSHAAEFYTGSSIPLTDFTKEIKAEGVGDISQEFMGFYEGLARSQSPFDVIDEENSIMDLSGYELLVLPNVSCLSEQEVESIKDFVRNGGNLVATFETSLYNQFGEKQNDFQLSEVFGVKFSGEIFGQMKWDYLSPVPDTNSPLLEGITKKYIPAPDYGIKVEPTTGKIPLYFCGRLKGRYDHTPEISSQPFMVVNQFGKGKAIYLAGTFGINLTKFRFAEYLALVKNFSYQLTQPLVTIEDAPWVEVNLRQKDNKLFLHLINQTSGLKRPLTYIHSLTDLKINLFNIKVKEGYALRANKKLNLRRSGKNVSLVLPSLKDYEVICLEKRRKGDAVA